MTRFSTFLLFCLAAVSLAGQSYQGQITGVVEDSTGGVVPNAKVVATNVATGLAFSAESNNQGIYRLVALPPARYKVSATVTGFKGFEQGPITLQVNDILELPIKLQLGNSAEKVEVSASAELLQTNTATMGTVVNTRQIENLPLNVRDPLALVGLTAGVTFGPNFGNGGGQELGRNFFKSDFNVGGGRSGTQELLLDGAANTTADINRGIINPPVDSVQEFKVQSNSYDAEFGRTTGGVVNVITKSGANDFHGLLYDFERHSVVEANNWFNNRAGVPNPSFKRHQFGANAREDLAQSVARAYRETMAKVSDKPILDEWYRGFTLNDEKEAQSIGIGGKVLRKAGKALKHATLLIDLKHTGGAQPVIRDQPPLVYHPQRSRAAAFRGDVERMFGEYATTLTPERQLLLQRYRLADAAYKVVGIGAVGMMCGVLLMVSGEGEALYLQFKEATQSVLESCAGPSPYKHHGERVVRGQRLIQAAGDILLGYAKGPTGRHIYVRQLRDAKIKPALETMTARSFRRYAETCGEVLARAHARTADAVVLAAYLGKGTVFDRAVGRFAMAYSQQTVRDHTALLEAIKSRRLPDAAQDS